MAKRIVISIPVNEEQKKQMEEMAKSKGMTVSAYLRYMAIYAENNNKKEK
jgi:antitoxin component of RelBE/YafQ-DinJ toxin-antitoxin module